MTSAIVDVWWASVADATADLRWLLDADESARFDAFRRAEDATQFLLGVAMVRALGARHLGIASPTKVKVDRTCTNCGRPHGKVRLPDSDLELSVTHSGRLVGVAVHQGASIGLDVEHRVKQMDISDLISHVLAPVEAVTVAALPDSQRLTAFLRYWTCKEAVLKCTGTGFQVDPRTVVVSPPGELPILHSYTHRPELRKEIRLYEMADREDCCAAVAVRRPEPITIREHQALEMLTALG